MQFQILLLPLHLVLALLKPKATAYWAEVGRHIYNDKGVSCALILTIRESRKFKGKSKTKQRGRLMGVLYPFLPFFLLIFVCQEINGIELYIHIRGAFSVARFDLQGNARAYELWNE